MRRTGEGQLFKSAAGYGVGKNIFTLDDNEAADVAGVLLPIMKDTDPTVEACAVANRKSPDEPITIVEYIEELIINRVVELGLLRKNKRKWCNRSLIL